MDRHLGERWQRLAALREGAVRGVRTRTARPDDAEDLVHEAMLRLAARPRVDLADPRACALVVRTACGIAIDRARWQHRQGVLAGRLVAPCADSPEDVVADRSEAAWLAEALPQLGRMERAALLHTASGLDVGEIAALLGVGYKAAENALGRARRKLRLRAAAVVTGLAALLRRLTSQPESAMALAVAPAVAIALLIQQAAPLRVEAMPAPQALLAPVATTGVVQSGGDAFEPARPADIAAARRGVAPVSTTQQSRRAADGGAAPAPTAKPSPVVPPLVEYKPHRSTVGNGNRSAYLNYGPSPYVVQTACVTMATCIVAEQLASSSPLGVANNPAFR
jgi:RNA polymerase sigma factor (sigma-70 family)